MFSLERVDLQGSDSVGSSIVGKRYYWGALSLITIMFPLKIHQEKFPTATSRFSPAPTSHVVLR